jgi:hypothetical protein
MSFYKAAVDLFAQLNGEENPANPAAIHFDLLAIKDTLSVVI